MAETTGKDATPKGTKPDRMLAVAKGSYERHMTARWPYLLRDGRRYRFEGPERKSLGADLGALWRDEYPDEPTPGDQGINRVVNDLRRWAEDADPDPETADDLAGDLLAGRGITPDLDSWEAKDAASAYEVRGGALGWHRPVRDGGSVWTPLATFDAEITDETVRDDGAEQSLTWTVHVRTTDGRAGEVQITPDQLSKPQQWAAKAAGVSALVMPGLSIADQLRVAVQSRSTSVVRRTVYTHTGWRLIDGHWVHLTSSGALGAEGLDETVTVDLGPSSGYALPPVPAVRAVRGAIRESLALIGLAPDTVTVPLLAAVYRAPLPLSPECAVWGYGESGTFKSEMTALAQQHFGPGLHVKNLPGNWTSSGNDLEVTAYMLDGVLFVVDDYSPDATKVDAARRAAAADRLIRGSANHSGRGRLRPDSTRRPVKPPRGLVLTSAEDIPPGGASLRARTFVVKILKGDVSIPALTEAQKTAAAGTFAVATAAYVQSIAVRYDADSGLGATLAAKRGDYRDAAQAGGHPRAAENIASLALGWQEFLSFAEETGAITEAEGNAYWSRAWSALCAVGAQQAAYAADTDPVGIYLGALRAMIASDRVHVAEREHGGAPENPVRWGWTEAQSAGVPTWRPQGDLIGWVDGDDLYLNADVAYKIARQHAEAENQPLAITKRMLHEQLRNRKLLASSSEGHITARVRVAGGQQPSCIHLTLRTFDGEA